MNNIHNIHDKLELIRRSEGYGFVADENSLSLEYQRIDEEKSGLVIKILSIAGGFLATVSFIGFLLEAGLYNSEIGLILFGVLFIAGAIYISRKYQRQILDTSAISVYIIGFCLLALGISHFKVDKNILPVLFMIIAAVSISITQRYMLSFISVLIINGSLLSLIVINDAFDLVHFYNILMALCLTYCFLKEAKIISAGKKLSRLYDPLRLGLLFSLLAGLAFVGKRGMVKMDADFIWLSSVIIIPAVIYLVFLILKILEIDDRKRTTIIYILSVLLLIPTAFSPAISGSLLIILLCFFVNYKTGFVTGIIAFIYFVGQYYYDLNFSLLTKSLLLFTTGVLLIIFFLFTSKKLRADEKN
ncbi:MAG: DUF4401 domain-containing protein [Mariniphaga sp.]|nr:DUF4401 domain-containing protein [Mariniphaga sp.]